jgi:hypothetical protein
MSAFKFFKKTFSTEQLGLQRHAGQEADHLGKGSSGKAKKTPKLFDDL